MKHSSIRTLTRMLSATALLLATATAADAQATSAPGPSANAAAAPWTAIPAGVYKLDIQLTDRVLPTTITIKDSSGAPTGTLTTEGDQDTLPVKVTVRGTELVINGEADNGPFEIVLLRQGEDIAGRWTYDGDAGKLTGKVKK